MIETDKSHRVERRKEKPTLDLLGSVDCEFTEGSDLVSFVIHSVGLIFETW